MSSSSVASLSDVLSRLESSLIEPGDDFDEFTSAHHDRALGYRVLAAAAIEGHVEQLAAEAARTGVKRLGKNQPTRAGRAIVSWYCHKRIHHPAPVFDSDYFADYALHESAIKEFEALVKSTHGVGRRSLEKLLFALGVRMDPEVEALLDKLEDLAHARNPPAHTWVNRAKQLQPPSAEVGKIRDLIGLLEHLHEVVAECVGGITS